MPGLAGTLLKLTVPGMGVRAMGFGALIGQFFT